MHYVMVCTNHFRRLYKRLKICTNHFRRLYIYIYIYKRLILDVYNCFTCIVSLYRNDPTPRKIDR